MDEKQVGWMEAAIGGARHPYPHKPIFTDKERIT